MKHRKLAVQALSHFDGKVPFVADTDAGLEAMLIKYMGLNSNQFDQLIDLILPMIQLSQNPDGSIWKGFALIPPGSHQGSWLSGIDITAEVRKLQNKLKSESS